MSEHKYDRIKRILDDPMYEEKFLVLNLNHARNKLTNTELLMLDRIMTSLDEPNSYLVVNMDEPYADKVWDLIKAGELAKED